ncbi:RNA-binding protein 5 [Cichlidogyrus casuarinus]|uniref:RNA-binding protein 5 n=1 Tax=Cichlidogyrus casuarinus TaxID=1844966 RepID=A0ABD2QGB8_9PLAT
MVTTSDDGSEYVGTAPCNTLVVRNLDALTVEEEITSRLQTECNVTLKNCLVIRDEQTQISCCFALVEMPNVADAYTIMEHIKQNPFFEIKGKAVQFNYSKNTFSTILASLKSEGSTNARTALSTSFTARKSNVHTSSSTAAALSVAESALKSRVAASQPQTSLPVPVLPFSPYTATTTQYPLPDQSKFILDPVTKFQYDPFTGLLYEPNSKYYFDRISNQYYHYDPTSAQYIPASEFLASQTTTASEPIESKTEKEKTNKTAKQIARDMERWAKKMNSTKEIQNVSHIPTPISAIVEKPSEPIFDIPLPMPQEEKSNVQSQYNPEAPMEDGNQQEAVSSAAEASIRIKLNAEAMVSEEEENLVDFNKLACMLCSRGFKDAATLQKHREMSQLHNTNYNELRAKHNLPPVPLASTQAPVVEAGAQQTEPNYQYRDRAKERRAKFGTSPPKFSRKRDHSPEAVAPTQSVETPSPDIGSRLLSKMGWQSGQGLGRANQGRTELVEAEFREAGVGLGVKNSKRPPPRSTDYRQNAKWAMFARFYDS